MASDSSPSNRSSQPLLATDSIHSLCRHRALPVHSSFLYPHILAFFEWCLSRAFHTHPIGSPLHPLRCEKNVVHHIWGLHVSYYPSK
ncbi:hypothetical protein COCMIDRAFT_36307 [Bipolaris oryzae ATCC 44560]|uniref:Uncharacterized protein n=1 Tax=Bipolaris oryzae ATCC 44560 TaxID=930090 RepID=W6Z886_COCMI|nr:uncharacterized protein COCMIDRAFT_36307 [Bipolaris oryzae ATCC 44560]EUC46003.1 hypothetical protein COCMIDRAFT_36307 [Bipolaris oryzae ATCC 44560]